MTDWHVHIDSDALAELAEIRTSIIEHYDDEAYAYRVIEAILERIEMLAEMPLRHRRVMLERAFELGVRHAAVGSYTLFFTADEQTHIVSVHHIMHMNRDAQRFFSS